MPFEPAGAFDAGEHEMDDVGRQIMLAPGDEYLLAADRVGAIGLRNGPGGERAEIRASLRLGKVHRAGPFAGDQLAEIKRLLIWRAVLLQRLDGAERKHRQEPKAHIR